MTAVRAGLAGDRHFECFADPLDACRDADLVTTDVWTSMGFEAENASRMRDFAKWRVDAEDVAFPLSGKMTLKASGKRYVIDGPQSVVWDEAENRLHAQKALLEYLVCGRCDP